MQNQGWLAEAISWLRQFRERIFVDTATIEFLKTRNARLTIKEAGSQSFFVVKVLPETNLGTTTAKLRFRIKLLNPQTIQVSVYNRTTRQMLVNITVPTTPTAGAMNLNIGDISLKMDIDDDPAIHPKS